MPCLRYDDPVAAAEWLTSLLGARQMVRAQLPDGWVCHVELELNGSVILIGRRARCWIGQPRLLAETVGDQQPVLPGEPEDLAPVGLGVRV